MNDLSLHILDVSQNSVMAIASSVTIKIIDSETKNILEVYIDDNGKGMDQETLNKVTNPFYTSRTERNVGMGLAFLDQSAQQANGKLEITSKINIGTKLKVSFQRDHIDRPIIGDLPATLITLFSNINSVQFNFSYTTDNEEFSISTGELNEILEGISLNSPSVLKHIKQMIKEGIEESTKRASLLTKT